MIRLLSMVLFFVLGTFSTSGLATARLDVRFVDAGRYTDASLRHYHDEDCQYVCDKLKAHMAVLAARYLSGGQKLDIEVTDIDLAGRFEPWRIHAYDVRYLSGATWPRVELRFKLRENGRILANREETVSDLTYLMRNNTYLGSDRLHYEKRMLDEWFRERFSEAGSAGRDQP